MVRETTLPFPKTILIYMHLIWATVCTRIPLKFCLLFIDNKMYLHLCLSTGGNAYLHWKLAKFFEAEKDPEKVEAHWQKAEQAITVAISLLRKPSTTSIAFYIGNAGQSRDHMCRKFM